MEFRIIGVEGFRTSNTGSSGMTHSVLLFRMLTKTTQFSNGRLRTEGCMISKKKFIRVSRHGGAIRILLEEL